MPCPAFWIVCRVWGMFAVRVCWSKYSAAGYGTTWSAVPCIVHSGGSFLFIAVPPFVGFDIAP